MHFQKHIYTPLFIIFLSLLCHNILNAQGKGSPQISGAVVDEESDPVPYASVAVYSTIDSTLITGAASDGNGKFSIPVKPGDYYLKVSFLSYEETYVPAKVAGDNLKLGTVVLKAGSMSLDEVEIVSEKSQMELKLDKRVFNVGKDLSNRGGNASEILDNVPSVTVDVEGNVSLRGSNNVRILIDGKPSGLVGISSTDALRQLQGNMIERIEVITNPSAKYDAEGEVGIINIILKKEKKKGVNGSFDVSAGYPDNYSGSFNLNFRKKWMNLFSSYGINYRKYPGSGYSWQEFSNADTSYIYERERRHTRGGLSNNLRLGSDVFLNDKNTLTISGLYKLSDGQNEADVTYNDYNQNNELVRVVTRDDNEDEDQQNVEFALSHRKTFAKKGQELTLDAKWMQSDDVEMSTIVEETNDGALPINQRVENNEDEKNWLFQADYTHPIGEKGKLEAGAKSTLRLISNDYTVEEQSSDGDWMVLDAFDNHFAYTENIHAAYFILGNEMKNFSYQGGLRAELSDITTELKETQEINHRKYLNLFPSLHLSYSLKNNHTLQLSYSRRLNRPRFRSLLPFFSFSDNRNFYSGNPDLNPEFTHSFETGHLKRMEKGSILSSIYYRYQTGTIQRITTVDSVGFIHTYPANLATQNSYGVEFNASYDLASWWSLNGNANFYRAITEGEHEGQDFFNDTYTWTGRLSSKTTVKKVNFQASGNYRAPRETPQGRAKSMYSIDLGLSKNIFSGKGTITLSVRDVFNTRKWRSITYAEGFYSESEFQWRARQFLLNFTYQLNQKKRNGGRGNGDYGGGDEY